MPSRTLGIALLASLLALPVGALAHEDGPGGEPIGGDAPHDAVACHDGVANGFPCRNVDLLAWLPAADFGMGLANDIWGWTDAASGREYALLGLERGTAFVDLSDPTEPIFLGRLPTRTRPSTWRDIKTHRDHAFIVSEAPGHAMQIFDLLRLPRVVAPTPVNFGADHLYAGFGSSHNLAIDEATGRAFAVGTRTCAGGLHMVDVERPLEPRFEGCFGGDGYTHDVQCVVYAGPDAAHLNREVCFAANEDTLTVVDVTAGSPPRLLARAPYAGNGYAHQGWLTPDQRYFLLGDELDELADGHHSRTYVWDVTDLDAPFVAGTYTGPARAIDHNLFVKGNHVFQANYRSGLRVLRAGDLSRGELVEIAYFDTLPAVDGLRFEGAWGVYPFFESGIVIVSDTHRGLFVLHPHLDAVAECADGIDNDADGRVDYPDDPSCAAADGASEAPRSDVAVALLPGAARSGGLAHVAVLGAPGFDVARVDPATLRFGPGGAAPLGPVLPGRDVDRDGSPDLVAGYPLADAGLPGDAERACLRWSTRDGVAYAGCDALPALPPGRTSGGR